MTQTILVLGATSAIAAAYCRCVAPSGMRFVLVARNQSHVDAVRADLTARGASQVATVVTDLSDSSDCTARFSAFCREIAMPDTVLLAYGVLGQQETAQEDPDEMRRILDVNFVSAAAWLQVAAKLLPHDKPRRLIVLSSVAGDRGRASNYVYGAAKAGLDAFCEGLAHRLFATPIRVLTVKPGFVDTPMTSHLDRSGFLWSKPEKVAADIERAVRRGRRVLYTPWFWRPIMLAIRFAPRSLFYRTKL